MSVDFPHSYSAPSASANKPSDAKTLQETFAAVLRTYGSEKGGSQTNTLLEVISSNADHNLDEAKQRREHQQHTDKKDFAQLDRKLLDKSEIRSSEMNVDYQDRRDRNETLRNDYQSRVDRSEHRQSLPPSATRENVPPDTAKKNEPLPNWNPSSPPQKNVVDIVNANNHTPANVQPPSTNITASSVMNAGTSLAHAPGSMHVAESATAVRPQAALPQSFTVFTPSGRFGQSQEKPDDNEDENKDDKEEHTEEQPVKKKQPFAVFESIRAETTRPVHYNNARQPKEPIANAKSELPKELEPEKVRTAQSLDDFLNAPAHTVLVKKKGENRPNQMQYLNRIAAACEAAAEFAPIRMKINLDHLGTLTLRFYYKADKLALRFETPSAESAKFLRSQLDGLHTLLAKRNVKIADVEIQQGAET
ncbi:MAG: flagellar hook-length control protein FliK [Planctomycetaceae bacterium]|nr:flagellar hook-length control protein FliK [Planctomycetaceae bacterium]